MKKNKIHDKYLNEIMSFLNERGFSCIDFEKEIGDDPVKRPDVLEENNDILIEIKTLCLNKELEEEGDKVWSDLDKEIITTYWISDTKNLKTNLKKSSHKFRDYPSRKSMVVVIDLMGHQRQDIKERLIGKENYDLKMYEDGHKTVSGPRYTDREIRFDKNKEIGVIAQYDPEANKILVIHNSYAEKDRQIPYSVFEYINNIEQINIKDLDKYDD